MIRRLPILSLLLLLYYLVASQTTGKATSTFLFHDQTLQLPQGENALLALSSVRVEELAMRRAFQRLNSSNYRSWLEQMQNVANRLQLNDWLYCELLSKAILASHGRQTPSATTNLTLYFLLAKSGFDVRLTYRDQQVFVNIFTEDELFEVPLIEESGRSYANISMIGDEGSRMRQSMFLLDHHPNPGGRSCSFLLSLWPKLYQDPQERNIAFQYYGLPMEVPVKYNAGIPKLLANYPLVAEQWYLEAPLSDELKASLVESLRTTTKEMTQVDALALIASFTRSSFRYRNDNEIFGTNKPMVSDELFFYPYSDCEDRTALFYALVKEILQLPMIVIAYDDHLTIAVAADDLVGDAVRYQGRKYIFCDPTGPANSSEIGEIPSGYENKQFEIIGTYSGS